MFFDEFKDWKRNTYVDARFQIVYDGMLDIPHHFKWTADSLSVRSYGLKAIATGSSLSRDLSSIPPHTFIRYCHCSCKTDIADSPTDTR